MLNRTGKPYLMESNFKCPYAKAMCKFMNSLNFEERLEDKDLQFLTNILQGLVLQRITKRICDYYTAQGIEIEKKLTRIIMNFLSNNLFSHFRKKITENPDIVIEASLKFIKYIHKSSQSQAPPDADHLDRFFMCIIQKYFVSENIGDYISWFFSNKEIKDEILLHKFKTLVSDPVVIDRFEKILRESGDKERIVFERYVNGLRVLRLVDMLRTREWQIEAGLIG